MPPHDIDFMFHLESAGHVLRLETCPNLRDLGGYDTPDGPTRPRRYLRCGTTRSIGPDDLARLRLWGVRHALDLRSRGEAPELTCAFAHLPWARWANVPLFDYDMSAPQMLPVRDAGGYFTTGYLRMLSSAGSLRQVMAFLSPVADDECALFHCAAGMDRTGVVSMLLLGVAGVSREQIVADYAYSFAPPEEVDAAVEAYALRDGGAPASSDPALNTRISAIATVFDTVVERHGSVRGLLEDSGVPARQLDAVRAHLLG